MTDGQFQRVAEHNRHSVNSDWMIWRCRGALEGDTLLAILLLSKRLRVAGFDTRPTWWRTSRRLLPDGGDGGCWIWRTDSQRISRACTTLSTRRPGGPDQAP